MNRFLLLAGCFLALLPAIFFVLRAINRRQARKTYTYILQVLDRAIAGQLQPSAYDESMHAAVIERLNRVVQITHMHRKTAEKERDTLKSLISDISHQVRTPLANIMLYADLLKEANTDPQMDLFIEKLQKQSDKLYFFMKELIRSSYAEQEIIAIRPSAVPVEEMVAAACQTVELAALKKEIQIAYHPPSSPGLCYADRKWTIEAIGNVLDNAVKYAPKRSVVSVSILSFDSFLCVEVTDQGPGIQEAEQGLVYERFYRSPDVKETAGFGIGLYLVREVLSKQRGYSKIRSVPGEGTSVQIFLSRWCKR